MTTTATAPLRLSRGTVFAVVALGLAVGAHLGGGGSVPDPVSLVFLGLPLVWVSFFLTKARRSWPIIVGALGATQIGLHEGLSLLSGPTFASASIRAGLGAHGLMNAQGTALTGSALTGSALTGSAMTGSAMTGTAMVMPPAEGMNGMPAYPGLGMLSAHLVATVLTGAVLAYGEQLLWSLWRWLRRVITVPAPAVRAPAAGRANPSWRTTANPVPPLVDRSVRRRGPPPGEFARPVCC